MELSFEVQQNLASLHDSKSVTFVQDEIFRVVCENLGIIVKFGESVSINDVLEKIITAGDTKEVTNFFVSLSTFLMAAATKNLSNNEIEAILRKLTWSQEHISKLLKVYSVNKDKIRMKLQLYGKNPPKLIDVDWRLDQVVETSSKGPIKQLLFLIELVLEKDGLHETVKFTATHPELEELVTTLKDAQSVVRGVSQSR